MWIYGVVFLESFILLAQSGCRCLWDMPVGYPMEYVYGICLWNMSANISSSGLIPILSFALKFPEIFLLNSPSEPKRGCLEGSSLVPSFKLRDRVN